MEIQTINVYNLKDHCTLTPIRCADLAEAAAVCLNHYQHKQPVKVVIEGDLEGQLYLEYDEVTQQMKDTRNDMDYTVEAGAYCLAILVIEQLTNFKVVKQSQKRTGVDYFLAKKQAAYSFQAHGRLEVSGKLKGTKGEINQRLKEKIEQSKKSDYMKTPAFVVIVEFSRPLIKIVQR